MVGNDGDLTSGCGRPRYFGFDSSAAFSTAWPVAFTSLPAPATVLHAVSEKNRHAEQNYD